MTPSAEALPPDQTPAGESLPEEQLHRALGLTDDEFEAVGKILGRAPNHLELALYAVMWSEHCSYKSSRLHLRRLPTEGPRVLVGPGENAGVIDAGDGTLADHRFIGGNVYLASQFNDAGVESALIARAPPRVPSRPDPGRRTSCADRAAA